MNQGGPRKAALWRKPLEEKRRGLLLPTMLLHTVLWRQASQPQTADSHSWATLLVGCSENRGCLSASLASDLTTCGSNSQLRQPETRPHCKEISLWRGRAERGQGSGGNHSYDSHQSEGEALDIRGLIHIHVCGVGMDKMYLCVKYSFFLKPYWMMESIATLLKSESNKQIGD